MRNKKIDSTLTSLASFIIIATLWLSSLVPFNFFQDIKLSLANHSYPVYYWVITIIVIACAIFCWLGYSHIHPKSQWFETALFLLLISILASALTSAYKNWCIRQIISFVIRGLLPAWIAYASFRTPKRLRTAGYFLASLALIISLYSLIELYLGYPPMYQHLYETKNPYYNFIYNSRGGIVGTIGHPIPLGFLLVALAPFVLGLVLETRNSKSTYFIKLIVSAVIFSAVFITFARSSWVSYIIGLAIWVVFSGINQFEKKKLIRNLIVIYCVSITVLFLYPKLQFFLHMRFGHNILNDATHRIYSYVTVYNIIKDKPLFGVGFGAYPKVHEIYKASGAIAGIYTPDNQYLRWIADTGIIGAFGLFIFIVFIGTKIRHAYTIMPPDMKPFFASLLAGLISAMVNLMAFDGFFWMAPNFAFWMMIGLLAAAIDLAEKKTGVNLIANR